MDLTGKKVLVTGGGGFLGGWLGAELASRPVRDVKLLTRAECDLRSPEATAALFETYRPDLVIHAAGLVGGLEFNLDYPADIFTDGIQMNLNVLASATRAKVAKVVFLGSSCCYPGDVIGAFKEASLFHGPLHASTEAFGFWKQSMLVGARAYEKQYGLRSIFLMLTNLYGPGDDFDEHSSHVVAALVRKFAVAKQNNAAEVTCWGTGDAVRECLFVRDAAQGVILASERYESLEPMNMGPGVGTSIKTLAETIQRRAGYPGRIVWDTTKPNGAMLKTFDVTRMQRELGWTPPTSLDQGLEETMAWVDANYESVIQARATS